MTISHHSSVGKNRRPHCQDLHPPCAHIYPTLAQQLRYALGPRPVEPLPPDEAARLRPLIEDIVRQVLAEELPEAIRYITDISSRRL